MSTDNTVLATFGMYHREPAAPTEEDLGLIDRVCQFVRVAIERTRYRNEAQANEARFRAIAQASGDVIWVKVQLALEPWGAFIDPSQLESALLNLTANARDAMGSAGTMTIRTQNVILNSSNAGPSATALSHAFSAPA